jgi:hypothetical protein
MVFSGSYEEGEILVDIERNSSLHFMIEMIAVKGLRTKLKFIERFPAGGQGYSRVNYIPGTEMGLLTKSEACRQQA